MQTKTWPYGTKKNVTVLNVTQNGKATGLVCEEEGTREGFVLLMNKGTACDQAKPGDRGIITFKPGGPAGAHWEYSAREGLL